MNPHRLILRFWIQNITVNAIPRTAIIGDRAAWVGVGFGLVVAVTVVVTGVVVVGFVVRVVVGRFVTLIKSDLVIESVPSSFVTFSETV